MGVKLRAMFCSRCSTARKIFTVSTYSFSNRGHDWEKHVFLHRCNRFHLISCFSFTLSKSAMPFCNSLNTLFKSSLLIPGTWSASVDGCLVMSSHSWASVFHLP